MCSTCVSKLMLTERRCGEKTFPSLLEDITCCQIHMFCLFSLTIVTSVGIQRQEEKSNVEAPLKPAVSLKMGFCVICSVCHVGAPQAVHGSVHH